MQHVLCLFFIKIFALFAFFIDQTKCDQDVFVQTNSAGKIKGKTRTINGKSYDVFLAIPYAKPPVGNLRFKDPEPLEPINTTTVVDASKNFSKMCIQLLYSDVDQNEDCLYLNVLSPKIQASEKTKYPVMVWIHGGGFVVGSASEYDLDGTLRNIVSRGVVYVSLNYRLGIFGFFSTKSSVAPGNYGLMDQVEALIWVQKNIEFFGGDPTKVTIFGESAGGASVSFLTITPLTKGLFSQAIIMSGSALAHWAMVYYNDPANPNDKLLEYTECRRATPKEKPGQKCPYRNFTTTPCASFDELTQHQSELSCMRSKFNELTSLKALPYAAAMRPRFDGKFLPEPPEVLVKNRSPLNILIGGNQAEFAGFEFDPFPEMDLRGVVLTKESFHNDSFDISCTHFKHPGVANFAIHYYYARSPPTFSSAEEERQFWFQQSVKARSAFWFLAPVYMDAVAATKTKSKVYLYSWDYKDATERYDNKTNFYWKGASHASELYSLFDSDKLSNFPRNVNPSRRDRTHDGKAAEIMGGLWTNFAKYGNPTPDDSFDGAKWQPLSEKDSNYLSIEVPEIKMKTKYYEDDMRLWNDLIPQLEASVDC